MQFHYLSLGSNVSRDHNVDVLLRGSFFGINSMNVSTEMSEIWISALKEANAAASPNLRKYVVPLEVKRLSMPLLL